MTKFKVEHSTIEYERVNVKTSKLASRKQIEASRDVSCFFNEAIHAMELELSTHFYKKLLDEVEVKFPEDWWEAFKERWFPARLKKSFPVGYTTVKVTADEYVDRRYIRDNHVGLTLE